MKKTFNLSGASVPAKLIRVQDMGETSLEFGIPAKAGSLSSRMVRMACMLLMLLSVAAVSWAQNTTASISGTVKDEQGEPIEAATVQATNNETGAFYGTSTNRLGVFSLSGLRPGSYTVKVSFVGYTGFSVDNVIISVGKDYEIHPVLKEDTRNLPMVTISAGSTYFNETRTGQTYNVDNASISMLP